MFTLNDPSTMEKKTPFGLIVERFIVEEKLREIAAQPPGAITVKGFAYSTALRYLSAFSKYILPRWGEIPIEAIRPAEVLAWVKDLPLSGMTKSLMKSIMHLLFERAMLWDLLPTQRNPIDLVRLRGISVRKKKKIILSVEQFIQLRAELGEPYKAMVTLAICTGLRVSEVTALRWDHIKDGALLVQASSFDGRIGSVKSKASGDEIPLHPDILADIPPGDGLVFTNPLTGGPFYGGWIQQTLLKPLGVKLGIGEHLGWHAFRHTYRTLLDEAGAPVGVQQKLMRHANVSTTMNVYGSSTMSAKREANNKVVQMVVGTVGTRTA